VDGTPPAVDQHAPASTDPVTALSSGRPLDPQSAVPLWAQLRDALRGGIEAGQWPPGAMIPREIDLCARYDVSRITAARAVQELVREGLLRRRRGRGTVVAARRPAATATLAFVTPRFDGDWTLAVFAGFDAVAAEAGHVALLTGAGGAPTLDAARLEALLTRQVRGVAVSHLLLDESARALLPTLRRDGVPLVFAGAYDPAFPCDRVVADNSGAGRIATEHLLRLGHRRIAFLAPNAASVQRNSSLRGRLDGYHAALDDAFGALAGGERRELLDALPAGPDDTTRAERLLSFLERSGATAAVASNDAVAVLVMRYLRAAGLRVPDHLALVGISDSRLAVMADVPLTTVRIAAAELGAGAARLLLRRLEGDASPPQETVIPVSLVVRASCGARSGAATGAGEPYQLAHAAQDAGIALQAALDR
jgi:GntR family transcriptional regulator of arabinose operon